MGKPVSKPAPKLARIAVSIMLGAIFLLMMQVSAAHAEEADIKGTFVTFDHVVTWDYTYDDDYFTQPSDQYNHDLARLSLGMALAAFRDTDHPKAQDDNLVDYLQDMGFSHIETDTYASEPTAYSVACGLAVKEIDGTPVVVCAVCGGNYGKEWASNLTVGDMVRSMGFRDSSAKIQEAISDYVERTVPSGEAKLWVVGYSRGGAIANITAADCTESGDFEDVYAYTFATPRTTKEPVAYPNIFNIIQKEDLIPKIPLADWGFGRYGIDRLMVSPETDTDCSEILNRASELYREMVGSEMVTNAEINYQLRILVDYILVLFPDTAKYSDELQPQLVDIMAGSDDEASEALQILLQALGQYSTDDTVQANELKELTDYLESLIQVYYLQGGLDKLPPDQWDPQFGVATLFNAHFPFEYLAMMYASDDPSALFSENTRYVRLMIDGKVDIAIADGDTVLKEIRADGTELVDGVEDPYSFPDVTCYNKRAVITLPADRSYEVTVTSRSLIPQTISYTGFLFSGDTVRAQADDYYSHIMNRGDTAVIRTSVDGTAIEQSGSDYTDISFITSALYSPTTAMRMENNSVAHLTISGLVNRLLLLGVILIAQMIASIILMIVRKKKHRKRNVPVTFVWHGIITFLFALLEVAMWYFVPILSIAKMIPGTLACITIAAYAIKGCREGYGRWRTCWIFIAALVAYVILESLLVGRFGVLIGISLIRAYMAFLTTAYILLWHGKHRGRNRGAHTRQ